MRKGTFFTEKITLAIKRKYVRIGITQTQKESGLRMSALPEQNRIYRKGTKNMKRQEQKIENTWKLEDIYASGEAYDKDVKALKEQIAEFSGYQGKISEGPEMLLEIMQKRDAMAEIMSRLIVYSNQRYHEDTGNAVYQKLAGEAQTLSVCFSQACAWVEPELLALDAQKLEQYFQELPELADYRRAVSQVTRMRRHILDAATEELLAKVEEVAEGPANIFSMFNNADVRFPDAIGEDQEKHPLTVGRYISYMEGKDRTLRKSAFQSLYSVYEQYKNTVSAMYQANAKQADFFAKQRHYGDAREAALDANAIPVAVYDNLITAIHEKLPLMHRYVELRKKMMGLSELHMYDVYAPLVEMPEKTYSFEEAKKIVKRGLAPLGEDYLALLQEGFDNRWIDVYENEGKRTGAYSWGAYGTHPYVLLNYHGTLGDVFTLAHEMGHSLHTWYSNHTQPYRYASYRIFVAEVASTCNEALLIHDLLGRTEDETEKKYLINYFLDQFKSTMYRQTMFAEFERETHGAVSRGETLTSEGLYETYLNLNRDYFGEAMIVDLEIGYEWERIPHFYTPFYVYQYATGFAAAIAISSKILAGEPGIVEKYKKFLSSGGSMDPIDLLKICGVDMSSPQPVKDALDVFGEYLSKMEAEVSKEEA